jgi:selenide,water dikinase
MVESKRFSLRCDLRRRDRGLIYDPQTSGGLLLALPASQADDLVASLRKAGVSSAVRVGEVTGETPGVVLF